MKIIALLDCNNFYASCEILFNPSLRQRPLVILSNNDGCIIARSNSAKAIGIKMGEPLFKCRELIERHRVNMRSANFELYADISSRVMSILSNEVEELEIYSIDEAFMIIGDTEKDKPEAVLQRAQVLKQQVEHHTGIEVSLGIATSKTLAKVASKKAKQSEIGVYSLYFDLSDMDLVNAKLDSELDGFAVADVWGLGRAYQKLLTSSGIYTALDLKYVSHYWIKQEMKTHGLRTALELSGLQCIPLNDYSYENYSQSVICSRSFSGKVRELGVLSEALANYVSVAAYKLRRQGLLTRRVGVFLYAAYRGGNRGEKFYAEKILARGICASASLIKEALQILEQVFEPGLVYKKAGVVFYDLRRVNEEQLGLFDDTVGDKQQESLQNLIDSVNQRHSVNTVYWATMGNLKRSKIQSGWRSRQNLRSPNYTTCWSDLAVIL
jgi:DNA polymerase V